MTAKAGARRPTGPQLREGVLPKTPRVFMLPFSTVIVKIKHNEVGNAYPNALNKCLSDL